MNKKKRIFDLKNKFFVQEFKLLEFVWIFILIILSFYSNNNVNKKNVSSK